MYKVGEIIRIKKVYSQQRWYHSGDFIIRAIDYDCVILNKDFPNQYGYSILSDRIEYSPLQKIINIKNKIK